MKVKVISGLHKGAVGNIISEKENSYEIKSGTKEIIVLKSRCIPYSGVTEMVDEPSKKTMIGKVIQFRTKAAN